MIATPTTTQTTTAWHWQQYAFKAMKSNIYIYLYTNENKNLGHTAETTFRTIEMHLSRFDPNSELSQLNNHPAPTFTASSILFDALQTACWAAKATDGMYDPAILSYLEDAGYDRTFEQVSTQRPLSRQPLTTPTSHIHHYPPTNHTTQHNYQAISLFPSTYMIVKPVDLRLDLGGMGKGWAVDRVADQFKGRGPFFINAGGDIYAYASPANQRGWHVELVDPFDPNAIIADVYLNHCALATSTIAKRRWLHDGTIQHHLIDPRTGRPANTDAISVSVVASRTVLAEIYAKVALILGVEAGLNFLQSLPDVDGLIYCNDHTIRYTSGMMHYLNNVRTPQYH